MSNEIRGFFDESAVGRDQTIAANPVVEYEQQMRSRAVLEMLQPRRGEQILDVGCGNARDVPPLVRQGCRCMAIDYSEGMVREAKAALEEAKFGRQSPLAVADATRLPFADAGFDKVFASEVIEHIPAWEQAVAEMTRVLKPGGALVLTTPNRRSLYGFDRYVLFEGLLRRKWNHPYDVWKTFGELAAAVARCGLRVTRSLGICYVPGFIVPYSLPRLLKAPAAGSSASCRGTVEQDISTERVSTGNQSDQGWMSSEFLPLSAGVPGRPRFCCSP